MSSTTTDVQAIEAAWQEEGSLIRMGLRPAADRVVQAALVPPGGKWECTARDGAVTRSITWEEREVALVNPCGWMGDGLEGDIAMGIRATPVMDRALRVIFILARNPGNIELIGRISRAAIAYVEQPAPRIPEPEEEEEEREP